MSRSRPARVSSSRAIASASRRMSRRSPVTSPMIRMPSPGPGNGWRQTISGGQAELLADQAHLVLEQRAQRLDQLELQVVGQAADVVVRLDVGGAGPAAGLDDVGVERALHEERDLVALLGRGAEHLGLGGLEDPDELAADDLALLLGVADPGERVEEALLGVDDVQVDAGGGDEVALDLLGLALAQQPVVDEDAGQPVADGALDEGGRDRGVDAAGEAADRRAGVADLVADPLDLLLDDVDHGPGLPAAGDLVEEVLEHPLTVLGVHAPRDATGRRPAAGRGPRRRRPGVTGVDASTVNPRVRRSPSRRGTSRPCARSGARRAGCPARSP